jgi:hypothetical protein
MKNSKLHEILDLPILKLSTPKLTSKNNIINYFYKDTIICIKSSKIENHIKAFFKDSDDYLKIKHGINFFNETIPSILNIKIKDKYHIFNDSCPICLEKIKSDREISTECNHSYCMKCFNQLMAHQSNLTCPLCREKININKIKFNIKDKKFYSCKFKYLVQILMLLEQESKFKKYIIINYDWKEDFEKNFLKVNLNIKDINYIIPKKSKFPVNKTNSFFIQYTPELDNFTEFEQENIDKLSYKNEYYKILKSI